MSPHSASRSPSNTRARSPSNSSVNRTPTHTLNSLRSNLNTTKYTPVSSSYGSTLNKTTTNLSSTRPTFSKSMV